MEYRHRYEEASPSCSSLRRKIRSTILSSRCFRGPEPEERTVIGSPTSWIRMKERCKGVMARVGKPPGRHYGEFRYDPLSYALNFDEGGDHGVLADEEFRFQNFASRLPASPRRAAVGIVCV